jgi:sulfite exporter TauE/SafE
MAFLLDNLTLYLSAFAAGLLGGVHCVGMCGGVVGAMTFGLPDSARRSGRLLLFLGGYNIGRIASYTLAGLLVGGIGGVAVDLVSLRHASTILLVLAGVFMILLGLYLAGWWRGLAQLERVGGVLWKRIEPLARRLMIVRHPWQTLPMGLVWGWLPCGLVYSALILALTAGGPLEGALVMLSFGLGTLPNLMLIGVFAAQLTRFTRDPRVRMVAGLIVIGFGLYYLGMASLAPVPETTAGP